MLKTAGYILFVGCFVSFFTAVAHWGIASDTMNEDVHQAVKYLSIFHYFLPIPIASIIVGILLNANKIRNRKNIIVGIIFGLLMLIYGLFPAFFNDVSGSLSHIETQIGFEIPQYEALNYNMSTNLSGDSLLLTTLSFNESVATEFEDFMQSDSRWLSESDTDFSEVMPEELIDIPTDFFLVYNSSLDEFSELPNSDGEYEMIYIAYSSYYNAAYIYEYTVDYKS